MKNNRNEESEDEVKDPLALERTTMANERTLLSYVRTAIMLFATSVTLLYLARDIRMVAVGIALFAATVFTAAFGVWRHRRLQEKISEEARRHSPDD